MGGIFVDVGGIANGDPFEKIRVFKEAVQRSKGKINIAIFKFGYADIQDENHLSVQAAYLKMVDDLRKRICRPQMGTHDTPTCLFCGKLRRQCGTYESWRMDEKTLASKDVVFDLQALEKQ